MRRGVSGVCFVSKVTFPFITFQVEHAKLRNLLFWKNFPLIRVNFLAECVLQLAILSIRAKNVIILLDLLMIWNRLDWLFVTFHPLNQLIDELFMILSILEWPIEANACWILGTRLSDFYGHLLYSCLSLLLSFEFGP